MSIGLRAVRSTLYQLKREYGVELNIVYRTSSTPDLATGDLTVVKDAESVRRAIVLPSKIDRTFEYDLAFIASNKNFTYGGFYDEQRRRIIIDRRDLPTGFEIKVGYTLIFNGKRYDTESISEFEEGAGYLLVAKQELQVDLENVLKRIIFSTFIPSQTAEAVIE